MTTKLEGKSTRFLPFNLGHNLGKGNPPNPDGHKTSYLWERVWAKDAWLDILHRFIHVDRPEKGSVTARRAAETVIFPRYHQWDAVMKLEADAAANGAGHSYLIQHSAGSGKSNTIAWTAHRLSTLHTAEDQKIFDKVVVITDRVILDRQLQDTIYQFEHARGVVVKIDEDSTQLAEALAGEQARIIITTLQKFPFVIGKIGEVPARNYAVVIDEAHSSQTGEAAKDLRLALGAGEEQELDRSRGRGCRPALDGDRSRSRRRSRGRSARAAGASRTSPTSPSRRPPRAGRWRCSGASIRRPRKHEPFHLYSMRQAIEEGFIMDVLANYTTYQTFWKIEKATEEDPEYDAKKARRAIARFVSLHPHHLAQKAEIIVEHFRQHTAKEMGGLAKAMVVTSSRLHAVRYKQNIDKYIKAKGYADIKTLVAFSGKIDDGTGQPLTETNMNGFPRVPHGRGVRDRRVRRADRRREVPDRLRPAAPAHDVRRQAARRAGGRPDPLAPQPHPPAEGEHLRPRLPQRDRGHRRGVRAVPRRAPSRRRPTPTSSGTPGVASMTSTCCDPRRSRRRCPRCSAPAPPDEKRSAETYAALGPAKARFEQMGDEERLEFRDALTRFVRTYSFVSQIAAFTDPALERDYVYCRALSLYLRDTGTVERLDLGTEVELTHLRHQMTFSGTLSLTSEIGEVQSFFGEGKASPENRRLARLVSAFPSAEQTSYSGSSSSGAAKRSSE